MTIETSLYWKLFKPSACSVGLKGVEQPDVFDEIVANLVKAKVLPDALAKPAVRVLVDRERLASTGVGMNVAIPHVALPGLDAAVMSLSVAKHDLAWRSIDGAPVRILFTVLRPAAETPEYDADRHLEMMRWVSRVARKEDFRRFALAATSRTELVDLLKEMASA
jgi:mannitol/fructose-specific phosphotransferase system IIA component (Ntr-type)